MSFTDVELDELMYSSEYADFIMANGDRPCCNGDMLTELMGEGYLWDEFVAHTEVQLTVDN